ncbi:MAG: putative transrane anti-sigma factor [Pedosphaera sp.]|nr:putative transrane anti-sigma factor [Pedosphaera sp.]
MQTTNQTNQPDIGDMKHPAREAWMAYLYGELSRKDHARLAAHQKACADCRSNLQSWQSTMQGLDQYQLKHVRTSARPRQPILKWAAAAALILGIGFGLGKFLTNASADTVASRAALKAEIRAELVAELKQQKEALDQYKKAADDRRNEDHRLLLAAIGKVDADRQADYVSLRKELETVAVLTEDSFQQAQRQIVTLANYSQTAGKSSNH